MYTLDRHMSKYSDGFYAYRRVFKFQFPQQLCHKYWNFTSYPCRINLFFHIFYQCAEVTIRIASNSKADVMRYLTSTTERDSMPFKQWNYVKPQEALSRTLEAKHIKTCWSEKRRKPLPSNTSASDFGLAWVLMLRYDVRRNRCGAYGSLVEAQNLS